MREGLQKLKRQGSQNSKTSGLKRHGISSPVPSPHFDSVCVWLGLLGVCRRSRAPLPSVWTLTTALWWTGEIPSVLDRAVTWVPGKERHRMISPATKALLWPLCNCGHQAPLMHPQVPESQVVTCRYHIESHSCRFVQICNIPYHPLPFPQCCEESLYSSK